MAMTPWFSGMTMQPYDAKALRSFEAAKASRVAIDYLTEHGMPYEAAHAAFSDSAREIVETGWREPFGAPIDGSEFVYFARGRAFIGSLGGEIRRDMAMTGWVPLGWGA